MRRQILNLTGLITLLTLTLSFVAVLPATSQTTGPIITKLGRLRSMVEHEHPALENKVNAVIHQIEAGAFNGALNKLENDVKKSITAWVEDPEDLIDLVNEIIKDIEDLLHPKPPTPDFEISADPMELEVMQGNFNTSVITITSINNFIQEVVLTNSTTASGITLSLDPPTVVPPANGTVTSTLNATAAIDATLGDYKITVTGTSVDFEPKSVEIELKVIASPSPPEDTTRPTIDSVQRSPETPAYNESVAVTAFVFDDGGSGVKQVILNYSSGSEWTQVDMTFTDEVYKANIPAFPFDTSVEYRVYASDNKDNVANPSVLFSYKVIDPYPPMLRIDEPEQGSYLSGTVAITVFMKDQNSGGESGFGKAELSINDTIVKTWEPPAPSMPDRYSWNTATFGSDGVYTVKLNVSDQAGNVVEKSLTVTVDNTLPTAVINAPVPESYLRLSVLIKVTGSDTNFDKMEMRIDDELVKTSLTSGTETVQWNTQNHADGVHSINLTVYDKAGNTKQALVSVTVDNTPPLIGTPSWSPEEPSANADIEINVTVTEPAYGSGVENVTFWFTNTTMVDWQFISMELKDGNWTTILRDQSDTKVNFFITAFDRAGNMAETAEDEFTVAGPGGSPLVWILVAIAIILAGSGGATYYLTRRRKKGTGASSLPTALSKPVPSTPRAPARASAKKPSRRRV